MRVLIISNMIISALALGALSAAEVQPPSETKSLIADGKYSEAERQLAVLETSGDPKVARAAQTQREIIRRTRQDFRVSAREVLEQIKQSIPDATEADLDKWREAGVLQHRLIDGDVRYFRSAAGNLFRLSEEARKRRSKPPAAEKKFDLDSLIRELVALADKSDSDLVYPVHHRVNYTLAVNDDHPLVKPGAVVRAWLPYPQEYRQQQGVKLLRSEPTGGLVASNDALQRTIYFEQTIGPDAKPPRFQVEFEFVTSAYCPKLDPAQVRPYDTAGEIYRQFTAERAPHIVFTPAIKKLAAEIVGDETNSLEKARRIFRWVSENLPWVSEMEYSIIPSLSEKGLTARCGDCGVQGMSFITLCRAAGIPARWQSGWQTKPGDWNMHDWSEFYVEPWGWLPADASYGVRKSDDPRIRDFLCGRMDPYRLIVNLDFGRELQPPKKSFRSEPVDFQRGEIEIDGKNLYFDEWDWTFKVETKPLSTQPVSQP
jgi:hypothetical protein